MLIGQTKHHMTAENQLTAVELLKCTEMSLWSKLKLLADPSQGPLYWRHKEEILRRQMSFPDEYLLKETNI